MTSPHTQKKILIIIIALLVIANAVTLYMLMQKPGEKMKAGKRGSEMGAYLTNSVSYSKEQMAAYQKLREEHEQKAQALMSQIRTEKEKRLKYLSQNNFDDSVISINADTMARMHRELEIMMIQHLRDVRNLGTNTQQVVFDSTFGKYLSDRQKQKKFRKD